MSVIPSAMHEVTSNKPDAGAIRQFTLTRPRPPMMLPGAILGAALITLSFSLTSQLMQFVALLAGIITGAFSFIGFPSLFGSNTVISLGADGLFIQQRVKAEFISLAQINAINIDENGLELLLKDQTRRRWPLARTAPGTPPAGMAVFSAVQAALARYREIQLTASPAELLALQSAPLVSLDELAPLKLADGYRNGTSSEELWLVIDNPRVNPFLRGLAAALLPQPRDEQVVAALVATAESTIHPELKQALLAASLGNEQAQFHLLQQMRWRPRNLA